MALDDSGHWAKRGVYSNLQWIDDERVLFLGGFDDPAAETQRRAEQTLNLRMWNVRTGEVQDLEAGVYSFFYGNGRIMTLRPGEGRRGIYETRRLDTRESIARVELEGPRLVDPLNVRVTSQAGRPGREFGRLWWPLRDGDGVLDLGPVQRPRKSGIAIEHRDTANRVLSTLEVTNDRFFSPSFRYVAHANAYFWSRYGDVTRLEDGRCFHRGDGVAPGEGSETRAVPIPCELAGRGLTCHPTRVGDLVNYTGGGAHGGHSKTQGLHLVPSDAPTRILPGFVQSVAVSADGCRVAVIHAETMRARRDRQSTVKAFDVCALDGR